MTRNRIALDVSTLPWPEDIMISTGTRRDDWLYGLREISKALETPESTVYGWLEENRVPATRVRNPDRRTSKINSFLWIAQKNDVLSHYKTHISPTLQNGSKPVLIDSRSGINLPSEQSIKELTQAINGLRADVQHLAHDLQENSRAINKNNEVWKA